MSTSKSKPLCSKAAAKCGIHFLFPDAETFFTRTHAIGEPVFLQEIPHFWITQGPSAAGPLSGWAGKTFPVYCPSKKIML